MSAPGSPGVPDSVQAARDHPDSTGDHGIDDVVTHYAKLTADLDEKLVLIGHSFGGMIAQKLLGQDLAAAAVAIDAAQIKGVLPLPLSALRATLPVFRNPANRHRAVSSTAEQFRFAFGKRGVGGEAVTRSTLKQYRHSDAVTDFLEFPDRAHSLTIDSGWREVADRSLGWLAGQGL